MRSSDNAARVAGVGGSSLKDEIGSANRVFQCLRRCLQCTRSLSNAVRSGDLRCAPDDSEPSGDAVHAAAPMAALELARSGRNSRAAWMMKFASLQGLGRADAGGVEGLRLCEVPRSGLEPSHAEGHSPLRSCSCG